MKYVLGVDVGTTRVKAVVMDSSAKIISFAAGESKIDIQDNRVEQDPEEIWHSVIKVIRKITRDKRIKKGLSGLSLSTQGGTLIVVDKDNKPLRPAITWMDTRAIREGKELVKEYGAKFFYHITGWNPDKACLPLSQILWLQRKEKNIFKRINKYHFVDSFLNYKLTGKESIDPSNAAITMLYDIKKGTWGKQILKIARIKEGQLPFLTPSGKVIGSLTNEAARSLGLPTSVSVFSGGHDQYCAALGAGVTKTNEVLLSAGTAWVILAITKRPIFSPEFYFSPGPHVVKGFWGALTSIPCGGISLDWFLKNILSNTLSYEDVNNMVKMIRGNIPNFSPTLLDSNGGAFSGITLNHTAAHFLRSIMERLALEVKKRLAEMKKSGVHIKRLKMTGGGTQSPVWPKIVSEITKLPVTVPKTQEVASIGAALLCRL